MQLLEGKKTSEDIKNEIAATVKKMKKNGFEFETLSEIYSEK